MPEIPAWIGGAGLAITTGIQWIEGSFHRGALHVDPSTRKPGSAMTAVPGGGNTVKEIDAPGDSLQQIGGKSDSHKIMRDLWRQPRRQMLEDAVHHRFRLSYREASDGDPGPGALLQCRPERTSPELVMDAALDNGP